jgi:pSer/pThr/pTyr-binding forkhead associated (FHA) protein
VSATTVTGVHCSRHHLNDPRARFCARCGVSMNQASLIAVTGTRPSLGVLVFASGRRVELDSDLVVGRDAVLDPRVARGEAKALALDDRSLRASRAHAEIRLTGWDVHVIDRASTNGTFVRDSASPRWTRLAPGRAQPLAPGMGVAFGPVTATFESPLRAR